MERITPEPLVIIDESFSEDDLGAEREVASDTFPKLSHSLNSFSCISEEQFKKEIVEIKNLDTILKEKLKEEEDTFGNINSFLPKPVKRPISAKKKNLFTSDLSGVWKRSEHDQRDICMTDADKIRLHQLMSDTASEAFANPNEMLAGQGFGFDSCTKKRLDEINEKLMKLKLADSKHIQQNNEIIECEEFDNETIENSK